MTATIAKPRVNPANTAALKAEQFWTVAKQFANAAEFVVNASPTALVKAGVKLHSQPANSNELAAELASLSEKIDEIRSRLAANDGKLVSASEREGAIRAMKKMVDEHALLDSGAFIARRKVTRQALSKALSTNRVFYVEIDGQRYFPSFFADTRLERKQVEEVCKALGELPGASKLQFFLTKKASLAGKTPIDALAGGQYSRVRIAAQGFLER